MKQPPREFGTLRDEIVARHPKLSPRLQQIARFALEHPNEMALQTIAMLASRIGVPPSTIIRFAKALDYRGFSDMQAVFRLPLTDTPIRHRGRHLQPSDKMPNGVLRSTVGAVMEKSVDTGILALEQLLLEIPPELLEQAVDLLAQRRTVYVIGQRRSFPVAVYLANTLTHLRRQIHLLDGVGGMLADQMAGISAQDVVIAVSFPPYALETTDLAALAAARGAALIAIVDSPLNPITATATVCLEVHERETHTVPSLTATLCLVQTLAIETSLRLENRQRTLKPGPDPHCMPIAAGAVNAH